MVIFWHLARYPSRAFSLSPMWAGVAVGGEAVAIIGVPGSRRMMMVMGR